MRKDITAGRMLSLSAWLARLQAGDLQLQLHLHQVQAAHHLRDAMLHLHARAAIISCSQCFPRDFHGRRKGGFIGRAIIFGRRFAAGGGAPIIFRPLALAEMWAPSSFLPAMLNSAGLNGGG